MLGANRKPAATHIDIRGSREAPVMCCPSVYKLGKVGCRRRKQSSCRRDRDEGMDRCGFCWPVSSVTARLTARIANRRGILTSSNDSRTHRTHSQLSSSSNTISLATGVHEDIRNVACMTEVEEPNTSLQCCSLKSAERGIDTTESVSSVGKSEDEDDGMKKVEDDGCSGWWWWDTAWYDLTSVTPVDVSTSWNEFNSWLSTTVLDDNRSETKPNVNSSSSNTTTQHVTTSLCDEDEMTKEYINESRGALKEEMNKTDLYGHDSAVTTTLLRAASHGHRDVVCDILRRTSLVRKVATVDNELYDFINCVDLQVRTKNRLVVC